MAAVERVRETTRDEALKILAQPLPAVVKRGLSHEDALLGQSSSSPVTPSPCLRRMRLYVMRPRGI